jgi:NAD dependent epimerase/dehydratase family.
MISLVGYTGFVGSNIVKNKQFDKVYNSKNIREAYGTKPELLVFSGVRAKKYLANENPESDLAHIKDAVENIKKISPKKLVLISTIDVYKDSNHVTEDSDIIAEKLQPYGANRYNFEKLVRDTGIDTTIIRLPGLYGINLKKNFLYDLINVIPAMLSKEKFNELLNKEQKLKDWYDLQDNGYYKFKILDEAEKKKIREVFEKLGFSAINFTDSRAVFQFYNLKHLWKHINIAIKNNIELLNIAVEPIGVSEIYHSITGRTFHNEILLSPPYYNMKTKYSDMFSEKNGYIFNKNIILKDIEAYINSNKM